MGRRVRMKRRRALVAFFVLVGLLGVLAPALALTAHHGSASRATRMSGKHKPRPARPVVDTGLAVSVRGNRLVNGRGETLRLVGVNRSGTQYMCVLDRGIFDGPAEPASIAAMKTWQINAVRVPLNEDCWLGINGLNPAFSGAAYRAAIEAYVAELNAAGLYVILNVCWNAPGKEKATGQHEMLDASHGYTLWHSIATAFKAHPAVLFDLYNEPYGLGRSAREQWRCWEHGCGELAGMAGLVATVRSTGARNVILLGGLEWAADDSEWLKYEPRDPLHQLAATFHVYYDHTFCATESCWNQTLLPLVARVPLVAEEFGEMQCADPTSLAWLEQWMSYAADKGFSMLAWAWNLQYGGKCSPPFLITSYAGTPSPYGSEVESFYATHDLR